MSHDQINNNELLEERRILKTEIRDIEIKLWYKRKKLRDIEKRLRNDKGNSGNEQCEENINKNQETRKEKTKKRKRVNDNEFMDTDSEKERRS